jgi:hypothetical protein
LTNEKAAGAGLAHDEHVIAGARHGHAELQGFDRSFLAEHAAKGFQIVGCREAELFSGKRTGQRLRRKSQAGSNRIRHRASLHQAGQIAAFWRRPYPTGKARHKTKHRQPSLPGAGAVKPGAALVFFAKIHGTTGTCLNSKLRGWN